MTQILVIAQPPDQSAVLVAGQPPSAMGGWLVDVEDGTDEIQAASNFISNQGFRFAVGTKVMLFDPASAQVFTLETQLSPVT